MTTPTPIAAGDTVTWTIYPWNGSAPFEVQGQVEDVRCFLSVDGEEHWATIKQVYEEGTLRSSVKVDRLTRIEDEAR